MKKKRLIIGGVIVVLLLAVGGVVAMSQSRKDEPGSIGWKKKQYGAICERGVKEGLEANTTEYAICTFDLGYNIKVIEPKKSQQETTQETSKAESTETTLTVSDEQIKAGQKAGCVSLRATKLEDLIASNKERGISESDTRITYNSGIAQCEAQGF